MSTSRKGARCAAVIALAIASFAHAQVYKCTDASGRLPTATRPAMLLRYRKSSRASPRRGRAPTRGSASNCSTKRDGSRRRPSARSAAAARKARRARCAARSHQAVRAAVRVDFALGAEAVGIVPVIFRRYKEPAARNIPAIAAMPTPFSATRLLAERPRLRRYARILTDDPERADRLVEETLSRARQIQAESATKPARHAAAGAASRGQRGRGLGQADCAIAHRPRHGDARATSRAPARAARGARPGGRRAAVLDMQIAGLLRMPVATVMPDSRRPRRCGRADRSRFRRPARTERASPPRGPPATRTTATASRRRCWACWRR